MRKLIALLMIVLILPIISPLNVEFLGSDIDGYGAIRIDGGDVMKVEKKSGLLANKKAYAGFNTSNFSDGSIFSSIILIFDQVSELSTTDADQLEIMRLNGTYINSTTPTGIDLYSIIDYEGQYADANYSVNNNNVVQFIELGSQAHTDMANQLEDDYFSVGFGHNGLSDEKLVELNTTEGGYSPRLLVTGFFCNPPLAGTWEINSTCQVKDKEYEVPGDLIIYDNGFLNMSGTTNITFTGTDAEIWVYRGGRIEQHGTAGIQK